MRLKTGRSMKVSEWAGGYTKPFCMAILRGAQQHLREGHNRSKQVRQAYPADAEADDSDQVPEERFVDADEPLGPDNVDESYDVQDGHAESMKDVSQTVKDTVIQAHNRLGHPSRKTFLRMLRLGGSHPDAIRFAKVYQCPVCIQKAPPTQPLKVAANIRPYGFNHTVYIDLKFMHDVKSKAHAALSIVDAGTIFHRAVLLRTKSPKYVARKLVRHWFSIFGPPVRVVHDQGGEFERDFVAYMEDLSIATEVTASHAPWQLAFGERHGGMLGSIWSAVITEHRCEGRAEVKMALDAALMAKNTMVSRNGYSAYQALLGHEPRHPGSLLNDDDDTNLTGQQAIGQQGMIGHSAAMRHTAKMSVLKLDVSDKLRRAMTRGPPSKAHDHEFLPGTRVYFWEPHPGKGRNRPDPGRWRGPALVLIREKHNRYFVSWHGRLLLLAAENLRPASAEEAAAFDMVYEEAKAFDGEWEQAGPEYEDRSQDEPPPEPREEPKEHPQSGTLKGFKSV